MQKLPASRAMFFGKSLAPHPHHQNIHTQKRLSSCLPLVDPPLNYRGASLGSHGVDVVEGGGSCGEAVDGSRSVVGFW